MTTLLFVDDIAELRNITKEFLESEGVEVLAAEDGRQALELLALRRPDIIVSDILMPVMDGFELCRAVKSDPATCAIPFIFYTSTFLAGRDREFAAALGVARYLIKPMRLGAFLAEIRAVLEESRQRPPTPPLAAEAAAAFDRLHAAILTAKLHQKSLDLDGARREIEVRHSRFTRLAETMAEPVAEFAGDLRLAYANGAFQEWLGLGQGALHGQRAEALVGTELQGVLTAFAGEQRTQRGAELSVEAGLTLPDGRAQERRVTLLADGGALEERYVLLFAPLSSQAGAGAMRRITAEEAGRGGDLGIVGGSAALQAVIEEIRRVAPTDATVLIQGESGTGKELVADAIHALSPRRGGPFVKVNCGAIPAGLFESELFGHERGAFTGAACRRIGRFEQASGGTIFLDEVAELPAEMQVKLLRVLQEGVIERVGAAAPVRVDVRLIAATNSDLEERVRAGRFRLDLFYRLNVFPLALPPLRQRPGDIPQLVEHLLRHYGARNGRAPCAIGAAALRRLQEYEWPGNVRQLQNVLERAVIIARDGVIQAADIKLPESVPHPPAGAGREQTLVEVERTHILEILERSRWSIAGRGGAAELLGMNPSTLRSRMKKYGIRRPRG